MLSKRILMLIFVVAFLFVGCIPTPTPPNEAPIIISTPVTTATIGVLYTYDVNATDPDDDSLAYSLSVKPGGMIINSVTGVIFWTPTAKGDYSVVVKVSDGSLSDTQSFTIKVSKPPAPPVNHAPIITSIPGDIAIIGIAYLYDVNATDPNGDVLTYSLTKKPDDMTIDPTTGLISWTPASKQIGANVVIVKVSDGKKFATQSFTITVKAVEPDPEIELTGIEVDPKKMTLFVGGSETIKSVTATYEIKGFEVPIPLGYCTFLSTDKDTATVGNDGMFTVTAKKVGTADIVVSYKGKFDTVEVTVIDLVHNINQETYYHTIQVAVNEANPGDTIEVEVGTYNEAVLIDKQLILNGANASESIIDGGETTAITISADNVTVDGFTLDGGITLNDLLNTISGGTISNNIITGADSSVEPIKAQNGIRLGLDSGGQGVDHVTIENNTIINSLCKGIRFANTKEHEGGPPQRISYITIRNNEIKDNGSAGIETYGPGSNNITGNTISGNIGNGINLKFDDDDVVTGNTITNNTKAGIVLREVTNTTVENNIVSGHQSEEEGSGIWVRRGSMDNTISYNDITSNYNGILIKRAKFDIGQPSGNSINHNNIVDNTNYGILNALALVDPPAPVDATNNWWGIGGTDENAGKPEAGDNNGVSANVDYEPWSTSKF